MKSYELISALKSRYFCVDDYKGCVAAIMEERDMSADDIAGLLELQPGFRIEKNENNSPFVYWPDIKYPVKWSEEMQNKTKELFPDCEITVERHDTVSYEYVIRTGIFDSVSKLLNKDV